MFKFALFVRRPLLFLHDKTLWVRHESLSFGVPSHLSWFKVVLFSSSILQERLYFSSARAITLTWSTIEKKQENENLKGILVVYNQV